MPTSPPPSTSSRPRSAAAEALWRLVGLGLVGLGILTTTGFLGALFWVFDLTAHFRLQYAGLALLLLCVCALGRRGWLALAAVLVLGVNAYLVSAQVVAGWGPFLAPGHSQLRVVTFNVNAANTRHGEVVDFLAHGDFDVILVLETDQAWVDALQALTPTYRLDAVARPDNFGLTLLTRVPGVADVEVLDLGGNGLPSLAVHFKTLVLGPVALLGTHPMPPVGGAATAARDWQLAGVANWVRRQSAPVVVLGDLNVTPWSHAFEELLEETRLLDSGMGAGLQATWPAWAGPLGIPIDHCLHSDRFQTLHRVVGPSLGSDHHALVVELVDAH